MISSLFNQLVKGYFTRRLPLAGPVVRLSSWVWGPGPEPGRLGADTCTTGSPHRRCEEPVAVGNRGRAMAPGNMSRHASASETNAPERSPVTGEQT